MIFSPPSFIYNSAHILLQEFGCLSCPFNIEGLNPMSQGYFDSSGFDHIQGLNFGTYQRFEGPNFDTLSNAGMLNYLKSIPGTIPDMGFSDSHPLTGAFLVRNIIPVPEPETYAMLMAGLGVMSFRFRRKVADIC
jgi:hypothetical protein